VLRPGEKGDEEDDGEAHEQAKTCVHPAQTHRPATVVSPSVSAMPLCR
jgi:hypothetical protein